MTLRIKISEEVNGVVFTLTGRIQRDHVSELRTLLASASPDHDPVLDLRDVKLVDRDAVEFLARIEARGTELRNCSGFIRQWISQEQKGIAQKVTK